MFAIQQLQGDHLSIKSRIVREFDICWENIRKLTKNQAREKFCGGKLFIANFMFGVMPAFSSIVYAYLSYC